MQQLYYCNHDKRWLSHQDIASKKHCDNRNCRYHNYQKIPWLVQIFWRKAPKFRPLIKKLSA